MDGMRNEGRFPDLNLGPTMPPYKMGTMFLFFSGEKWVGREVDHSFQLCSKIENKWSPTSMTLCL